MILMKVAAGGGSRLFWKNGLFAVGPEVSCSCEYPNNRALVRTLDLFVIEKGDP